MAVALDEVRRLSADEVLAMVEAGVLDEDERLELWDGLLIPMSPQGEQHGRVILQLNRALMGAYPEAAVYCQVTMRFSDRYELRDPDFAVVLDEHYPHGLPRASDTALVVEIGVTSQARDRRELSLYAREGVGEVWLIDVERRRVAVYRTPRGEEYAEQQIVGPDGELPLPGVAQTIAAATCLPDA